MTSDKWAKKSDSHLKLIPIETKIIDKFIWKWRCWANWPTFDCFRKVFRRHKRYAKNRVRKCVARCYWPHTCNQNNNNLVITINFVAWILQVVVVSLTAGVALLTVLAHYLGRRKISRPVRRTRKVGGRRTRNSMRSPNGKWTSQSNAFLRFDSLSHALS